jgi:DNA-binding beta-propeller fold protein YncE
MRKIASLLIVGFSVSVAAAQRTTTPPPVVRTGPARLGTVAMIDLPGRPGFTDIAFANNFVVTSQTNANTIDVFDPAKRRLVAQVTNIAQPRGIAVDARNNRLYVATANWMIAVVSSQDWEVKDTFTVDGAPDVLALSADGMRLYVGDKANSTLTAVDTSLRKTIGSAQLGGRPESIAIGDTNNVFVSVQDQALIDSIDPQMKVVGQFKLQASQPAGLIYDSKTRRLYVAVRSGVLALNADNGAEVARVPAPRGVQTLAFDPTSQTLFGAGGGSVISLSTAGGLTAGDELLADVKGHAMLYDASRKLLFLPGGREGRSKMLIVKDLVAGAAAEASGPEAKLR